MSEWLPIESEAMATRVCSYSKINLGLAIGPVRADGFHGLTTLYQTLDLHDLVTVRAKQAAETTISLESFPMTAAARRLRNFGERTAQRRA